MKKGHQYVNIHLDSSCEICDQCYSLGRAPSKAKSESLVDDLKKIIENAENDIQILSINVLSMLEINYYNVKPFCFPLFFLFLKEYKTDLVESGPNDYHRL